MEQKIDKEIMDLADTPPCNRVMFNKVYTDLVKHYDKKLLGSEILSLYPIVDVTEAYLLSKYLKIYLDEDLITDLADEVNTLHNNSSKHSELCFEKNEPITVYQISVFYEYPILLAEKIFNRVLDIEDIKYGK